jgi:hypothetical protein
LEPKGSLLCSQQPAVPQLVNKYPSFYETQSFITTFTTTCHLSLPSASVRSHPV